MKKIKILSAILSAVLLFSLCSCGKDAENKPEENTTSSPTETISEQTTESTTNPAEVNSDEYVLKGANTKITVPKLDSILDVGEAEFYHRVMSKPLNETLAAGFESKTSDKEVDFTIEEYSPSNTKTSKEAAEYFDKTATDEASKYKAVELAGFSGYCQTTTTESSKKTRHDYYFDVPCGDETVVLHFAATQVYDDDVSSLKALEETVLKSIKIEKK